MLVNELKYEFEKYYKRSALFAVYFNFVCRQAKHRVTFHIYSESLKYKNLNSEGK